LFAYDITLEEFIEEFCWIKFYWLYFC